MSVLEMLADQADKIFLWQYLGSSQLAIYTFSIAPISQFTNFIKTISQISFPKMANKDVESIKKVLPSHICMLFLILCIPVILYIFFSPIIFKIFFPRYLSAIPYTKLYAITILFYPFRLMGTALTAHAQKKSLYVLRTSSALIKIILLIILLPSYGIHGAILSQLLSTFFGTSLTFYFFKKM
jgi:O-antigen/teichoic acid export membrane protein